MISLKSQITKKILNYYFLNPGARQYTNELARSLEIDPKNLDRKLKEFEKEGLLKSEFLGKQRYFYLNNQFSLLKEYKSVFLKTCGIEEGLKTALKKLPKLESAYIFGSYAKDSMDASSDIDILLIGSHSSLEAQKAVLSLQKNIQREINIVNMTQEEFTKKKKQKNEFIKNIFSQSVIKLV